jgi:Tol biopolymer transport system component
MLRLPGYLLLSFFLCNHLSAQVSLSRIPDTLSLFGKGILSTSLNERDMALSPNGRELYYTVISPENSISAIMVCYKGESGKWSRPSVVSFSGHYSDLEPAFSPDGKRMFFASNRPVEGVDKKDFDIWVVERQVNGKWSEAINIGAPVNTEHDEFYPSLAANGNLYFTASYSSSKGKEDIYMARRATDHYEAPVSLDSAVNSEKYEFNAFVSPDEGFILFTSYGRKDDTGRGDLYISLKDAGGKWQPAKNLEAFNSPYLDYCPYVSPDQKIFFFTSERRDLPSQLTGRKLVYDDFVKMYGSTFNGSGNIFWVSFSKLMEMVRP